jgi:hypothetical protein
MNNKAKFAFIQTAYTQPGACKRPWAGTPYSCLENKRGEAKEMKKALLCDTIPLQFSPWQGGKEGGYDPPAQNSITLTMSLPSGEYRPERSRHVRFFQRLCLDFMRH